MGDYINVKAESQTEDTCRYLERSPSSLSCVLYCAKHRKRLGKGRAETHAEAFDLFRETGILDTCLCYNQTGRCLIEVGGGSSSDGSDGSSSSDSPGCGCLPLLLAVLGTSYIAGICGLALFATIAWNF